MQIRQIIFFSNKKFKNFKNSKKSKKSKSKKKTEKTNQIFFEIITCNNLSDVINLITTDFHISNHFIILNNVIKTKNNNLFSNKQLFKSFISKTTFDNI